VSFPELSGFADNFIAFLQALGLAIVGADIALIALIALTSFGNEHRNALAKAAAVSLIVGFALLMAAPKFATMIERVFPSK
jgi:predicted membrane protein